MDLNELRQALEAFAKVDPEMQLPTMLTFVSVAQRGTCTQSDIESDMTYTRAAVSRNVSYWTDRRFDRKPGKNYFNRVEDKFDRRFKNISLTEEGKAFVRQLTGKDHGTKSRTE